MRIILGMLLLLTAFAARPAAIVDTDYVVQAVKRGAIVWDTRSAAAYRPCSSHEPNAPRPDLPLRRRDPVSAVAVAAPYLRTALSRDGARRDRRRRPDRDDPAAAG